MINRLQLIRNIGQFDSVNGAANIALSRLTLVYAENGKGKTTLAAILRSLGTNDPIPITERARFGAQHPPHVVLECAGGPPAAMFQNGVWNRSLGTVVVFDDQFVDQNVYSGLVVGTEHRQRLHEFILGAQGIALNQRLQDLVAQIEVHNGQLRAKGTAIPAVERGPYSVDEFCNLPNRADIDAAIQAAERSLAAAREQDAVRNTAEFAAISLPAFDTAAIEAILQLDLPALDADAAARVQGHLGRIGAGGEAWIGEGMSRIPQAPAEGGDAMCPFCAQDLSASDLITHYRVYFSTSYEQLKRSIADALATNTRVHGGDIPPAFERSIRVTVERGQFWSRFCDVPEFGIDTAAIARDWRDARDAVSAALTAKQAAPLERATLSEEARAAVAAYDRHRAAMTALSDQLQLANAAIRIVKEGAAAGNAAALSNDVARLKAVKSRHVAPTSALCQAYLDEKAAKAVTETQREQARAALDQYRTNVFPACQTAINVYLQRFNAGFRLDSMTSANTRGGSVCTYSVIINNTSVPIGGTPPPPGTPSFRSTLSAGDRNTLALAFFFASLDQDPALALRIVVIDDPMTSLDEHRSLTTVQEVRNLVQRVQQVIVLSHSKAFLCAIWQNANRQVCTPLIVVESPPGSTISAWTIGDDCVTEYDRQHKRLRDYRPGNAATSRLVAQDLRHVLEGFLRRCCPAHFLPGEVLGDLRRKIRDLPAGSPAILSASAVAELDAICEYANRFHHNTNPAWETEAVNETELRGWVARVIAFVSK
ncbi:MAG: AAA family ATPase [Phycisphaeraceae bacterium]|nr:AAA family ATPase [Phycisphaeraceae bacterium]